MVWGYFTHCAATIKCTSALNANMQLSMGALNTSAQEMEAEQWDRLQGWLNDSKLIHSDWCHFPLCAATIKCTRALKCQTCNTSQPRKRAPSARTAQWTTFFLFLKYIHRASIQHHCALLIECSLCVHFKKKEKPCTVMKLLVTCLWGRPIQHGGTQCICTRDGSSVVRS